MAKSIQSDRRNLSKTQNTQKTRKTQKTKSRKRRRGPQTLSKPGGGVGPRVKRVGGERFAIVCVDPAKRRSEWMMADFFGNVLVEPQTLEHQSGHFQRAALMVRRAGEQHGIEDLIVAVERTGRYFVPPMRAFQQAGFETRIVHPFATKQYRRPADPGNKTDANDLAAMHRAAVAGFGLVEEQLDEGHRGLRLWVRHRRDLVQKAGALACQIRDHLHPAMPGYDGLFADFFGHRAARAVARWCASPQQVRELGAKALEARLRAAEIPFQKRTIDKILAWAREAAGQPAAPDADVHHALWTEFDDMHADARRRIVEAERHSAGLLAATPYIRLLMIPGIGVVSAADFAGEMGPIANYAGANNITGRAGLYPSRYQSDQTDRADGPLVRNANRRLRATLMRIADNLVRCNRYYRGQAERDRARGDRELEIRVRVAKRFSRLAFACVAGDRPLRHSACAAPDSILQKLRAFHHEHRTPPAEALADLETAAAQLLPATRRHEADVAAAAVLKQEANRRRAPSQLGELLPALLAKLGGAAEKPIQSHGTGPG